MCYLYSENLSCSKLSRGSPLQDKAEHQVKVQTHLLYIMHSAVLNCFRASAMLPKAFAYAIALVWNVLQTPCLFRKLLSFRTQLYRLLTFPVPPRWKEVGPSLPGLHTAFEAWRYCNMHERYYWSLCKQCHVHSPWGFALQL